MKYQDRLVLQETIKKLETNDFDYKDIKSILIDLREYSEHKSHFREISHFVAHKDRDQGLVHTNVEGYFCSLQILFLVHRRIYLDYSKPPEPFLRLAILFRAEQLQNDFYRQHKIGKDKFIKQVKENLPLKPNADFKWPTDKKFYEVVNEVISTIDIKPLFESTLVVDDFIKVLRRNSFIFDEKNINKNKVSLMIIALLNDTDYFSKILNIKLGEISVALETRDSIEYLALYCNFQEFVPKAYITFSVPILSSDLIAKDWCTESFFNFLSNTTKPQINYKVFLNQQDKFDILFNS